MVIGGVINGDEVAKAFSRVLEVNKTLTWLSIALQVKSEGAKSLANALEKNRTLTSLDIGNNDLGTIGTQAIADILRRNATSLSRLNIQNNYNMGRAGIFFIADALKRNTTLTHLSMGNQQSSDGTVAIFEDSCAAVFASVLKENNTLRSLDLSGNEIRDNGATNLAEALKGNTSLASLHLNGNRGIGDAGFERLATVVANKSNPAMSFDSETEKKIRAALEKNHQLVNAKQLQGGERVMGNAVHKILERSVERVKLPNLPKEIVTLVVAMAIVAEQHDKSNERSGIEGVDFFANQFLKDSRMATAVIAKNISKIRNDRIKNGYDPLVTIDHLSQEDDMFTADRLRYVDINLETMCRMLTKDLKDPQDGSRKPGFKFAEIIAEKQYVHLHNILVISETLPVLRAQIADNLSANQGQLLNMLIPAAGNPEVPQEIRDKISAITKIANAKLQKEPKIVEIADDPQMEALPDIAPESPYHSPHQSDDGAAAAAPRKKPTGELSPGPVNYRLKEAVKTKSRGG